MRDDVEGGAAVELVLDEPGDRDLVRREPLGDVREHARAVVDLDPEVERRAQLAGREQLELAPARVVLEEAGAGRPDAR